MRTITAASLIACTLLFASPTLHAQDAPLTDQQAREAAKTLEHNQTVLLKQGEGEPVELRLDPTTGATTEYRATLSGTLSMALNGAPIATAPLTTNRAHISAAVDSIDDEGNAIIVSTFTEVATVENEDTTETARNTVDTMLSALNNMTSIHALSPRGVPTDYQDIKATPRADRTLSKNIARMAFLPVLMLPEEPVAPGAVWRARRDFEEEGLAQTLIYTYTLRDASDDTISVDVHGRFILDEQALPADSRAPQIRTTINTGAGSMLGELTIDRRTGALAEGFLRTETSLSATSVNSGVATELDQRYTSEIIAEPIEDNANEDAQPTNTTPDLPGEG